MWVIFAIFVVSITLKNITMKNSEKTIIEIRSKEIWGSTSIRRWIMKPGQTGNIWKHYCSYSDEWTTVHFDKENKRGFTFRIYFAGKYTDHFVSRGDCEIIYEL